MCRPCVEITALNYRHIYHAGNFADVFKHALLARMLVYLTRKDAPLRYLDTHAGIGLYDLSSEAAGKTGEWRGGIGRLAGLEGNALLKPYFDCLGPRDGEGRPAAYPGSPEIARRLLRPQDRLTFCELHPDDAALLDNHCGRDRRVRILDLDGYTGLKAGVPPPERRGLVLIDPPFEQRDEFERMAQAVIGAYRKWPTGTYALWHPLKSGDEGARLGAALAEAGLRRILLLDLVTGHDGPPPRGGGLPLTGCGMIVVNPPHVLEAEARTLLPLLAERLAVAPAAGWSAREIAGE